MNTKATVVRTPHGDSNDHEHRPSRVRAGAWGLLLGLSILGVLNHVLGVATFASDGDERMMFTLFAALDLYAMVVLLTAYRRGERWAWAVTWVHSAAYALAFVLIGPAIGSIYLIVAVVSALAQLATLPSSIGRASTSTLKGRDQ